MSMISATAGTKLLRLLAIAAGSTRASRRGSGTTAAVRDDRSSRVGRDRPVVPAIAAADAFPVAPPAGAVPAAPAGGLVAWAPPRGNGAPPGRGGGTAGAAGTGPGP